MMFSLSFVGGSKSAGTLASSRRQKISMILQIAPLIDQISVLGGVVVPIIDVGQTKDYVDRNAGGQVEWLHEVTQLGWYLRWKFAYLSGRTKKVISRKLKYVFTKKTTPQLLQHVGLQNIKEGVKTNFGRLTTIISNLFNGCWRPLLKYSIPVLLDRGFII